MRIILCFGIALTCILGCEGTETPITPRPVFANVTPKKKLTHEIHTLDGISYTSPTDNITISFGDELQAVLAIPNMRIRDSDITKTHYIFDHPILGIFQCAFAENRVKFIWIDDPRYKTEKGISVGSSYSHMRRAYGNPRFSDKIETSLYVRYPDKGLHFGFIENDNRIHFILISR